ncbi:hypothetical protein Selin_1419 [Desulfurispirillum indicum S5]|uniref:Uncharacterized protein n=1 Tax=Desulfurispirillum indicum (strain ATCC BAA-1389 / DSM 22839 / S5) TaxID=653733 RepID=E6W6B8_DESIS|nr:hypothetical protein [Desulfurispirillum indicum]ADU66154.1 hypothetical protein Selin_1419 [Desulfurispirillum indicum S5]
MVSVVEARGMRLTQGMPVRKMPLICRTRFGVYHLQQRGEYLEWHCPEEGHTLAPRISSVEKMERYARIVFGKAVVEGIPAS